MTEAQARDAIPPAGGRPVDSIAGGSARVLVARTLASAAAFVAVLLLARALDPAGRGAVAFVMMTGAVLANLSGFGLDQATMILAARRVRDRAGLLSTLCLLSLVAAAVVGAACTLALAVSPSVRPADVGGLELIALLLGTVALRLNTAGGAFLVGCSRFRDQAASAAAPAVLFGALLLLVWELSSVNVRTACIVWAGSQLAGAGLALFLAVRIEHFSLPSGGLGREAVHFGLRAWAGNVAGALNGRVDQVIMGLISTEAALGFYAVAVNASDIALYLPTAVALVIMPAIAGGEANERIDTTLRVCRVLVVITTAVVMIGFACAPLIPVVFGADYEPSIVPFLILLPGTIAAVPYVVFSASLLASSAPGRSSLASLAALGTGVALVFALVPPLEATGAAIAATAAFVVGCVVSSVAYILLTGIDARLLLPQRGDLVFIRALARRLLRRR